VVGALDEEEQLSWAGAADPLAERFSVDVGHHEVDEIVALLDDVDWDDVRVRQFGGGSRPRLCTSSWLR
jgi:hypothetical protein